MEKDLTGIWVIVWQVSGGTGPNACVDVCFVRRPQCKDNLQPIDAIGEE